MRSLEISTASADVRIEGNPPPKASYSVSTKSGDISLILSKDIPFRLEHSLLSGEVDSSLSLQQDEGKRTLRHGNPGPDAPRFKVSSMSGDLTIKVGK